MHIRILAVGGRQPGWVANGFDAFAARLPRHWQFRLEEIRAVSRSGRSADAAVVAEGEAVIRAVGDAERVIALDERGEQPSSAGLAAWLDDWQADGRDVCLVIGGPDGLSETCMARAERRWSLSRLTLPHGLVRVVVAEQLYRAWSLQSGHPYHRA